MSRYVLEEIYRCDLCRRSVDSDTRERARQAWQPLIICERCVRDAEAARQVPVLAAAPA